jgi:hypothetical protein
LPPEIAVVLCLRSGAWERQRACIVEAHGRRGA